MKLCIDCNIEKDESEYWKRKSCSDGLSKFCKDCGKIRNKKQWEQNKEKYSKKNKEYREINREELLEKMKEDYQKNKEKRLDYAKNKREKIKKDVEKNGLSLPDIKEKTCTHCKVTKHIDMFYIRKTKNTYEEVCKDCKKKEASEYRKQNREKINKYLQRYLKSELGTNRRIHTSLRNRLSTCVKNINSGKTKMKNELIGCSKEFLNKWFLFILEIESMTFEEYGYTWHIDHVIPCSVFDLENKEEIKKCFHWTNICPLEKNKNLQKSNNIHWPYIFVQEIRLRKFIKENHIEENVIQEWINGALTTAVYEKS